MEYRRIIATIHNHSLEAVEKALRHIQVEEVDIRRIESYGDYKNFYSADWTSERTRVEVFVLRERADTVVHAICNAAYAGLDTDGIVTVLPVDSLVHIKDCAPCDTP